MATTSNPAQLVNISVTTLVHLILRTHKPPFNLSVSDITVCDTISVAKGYVATQLLGTIKQSYPTAPPYFHFKVLTDRPDIWLQFDSNPRHWVATLPANHSLLDNALTSFGIPLHLPHPLSAQSIQTHLKTSFPHLPTSILSLWTLPGSIEYTCYWPTLTSGSSTPVASSTAIGAGHTSPMLLDLHCPIRALLHIQPPNHRAFYSDLHLNSPTESHAALFLPLYTHLMLHLLLPQLPPNWHLIQIQTPSPTQVSLLPVPTSQNSATIFSPPYAHALCYVPTHAQSLPWITTSDQLPASNLLLLDQLFPNPITSPFSDQLHSTLTLLQHTSDTIRHYALSC